VSAGLRTVLLTGASGFVGRPTLTALLAQGFHVHAVSRTPPSKTPDGVTWHATDLLDPEARRHLIEATRPTHLLHLAWYVEHGKFWAVPENEDWVSASLDLLKLFADHDGRRAVLSGSCAEYDWTRGGSLPLRETDPCRPATPYGRAKLALMDQAGQLASDAGLSFAWARFFSMFGFGEDRRRLIPSMVLGLLTNQAVALSSGLQIRDFLDTRDIGVALATVLAADSVTGAVNVASGRPTPLCHIGQMLAQISGQPEGLLQFGASPDREGEPPFLVADVTRLAEEARFSPTTALKERLAQCLDWHWKDLRNA
jgi:nucleoside-diphosphate-sugar epimerase